MSKSNTVEIISVLWLIAGLLAALTKQYHWLEWVCGFMFGENTYESISWAVKERRP